MNYHDTIAQKTNIYSVFYLLYSAHMAFCFCKTNCTTYNRNLRPYNFHTATWQDIIGSRYLYVMEITLKDNKTYQEKKAYSTNITLNFDYISLIIKYVYLYMKTSLSKAFQIIYLRMQGTFLQSSSAVILSQHNLK